MLSAAPLLGFARTQIVVVLVLGFMYLKNQSARQGASFGGMDGGGGFQSFGGDMMPGMPGMDGGMDGGMGGGFGGGFGGSDHMGGTPLGDMGGGFRGRPSSGFGAGLPLRGRRAPR